MPDTSRRPTVTIPFVLLLVDYWPLQRFQHSSQLLRLLREKAPFFGLSALSCVATVLAQKETIQIMERVPLSMRLGNALVAYCVYLEKMTYPAGLAVFYPLLKNGVAFWQVAAALMSIDGTHRGSVDDAGKQPF